MWTFVTWLHIKNYDYYKENLNYTLIIWIISYQAPCEIDFGPCMTMGLIFEARCG